MFKSKVTCDSNKITVVMQIPLQKKYKHYSKMLTCSNFLHHQVLWQKSSRHYNYSSIIEKLTQDINAF